MLSLLEDAGCGAWLGTAGAAGEGDSLLVRPRLLRFDLGFCDPLGLRLALAALRRPVLATLRMGAGRTRRKRWARGSVAVGGASICFGRPMGAICEGGIQGARR